MLEACFFRFFQTYRCKPTSTPRADKGGRWEPVVMQEAV
jgi:hypothetical protein